MKKIITYLKKTWIQFSDDDGFMMAGALAYYTLFSIAPLLIIIISIVSLVTQSDKVELELFNQLGSIMGGDRSKELQTIVENIRSTESGKIATIISTGTLFISATAVVIQLKVIMNKAWNVMKDPSLGIKAIIFDRILSLGFLVGLGFIFLVSLGLNAIATIFIEQIQIWVSDLGEISIIVISLLIGSLVTFIMFYLLFRFLPDAKVHHKDIMVGAFFTTVLFIIGKYAIGFYIGNSNIGSTFGSAGALASFMIWVYYNVIILIFGAEFTQVYALDNDRFIKPTDQSVKVERIIKEKPVKE